MNKIHSSISNSTYIIRRELSYQCRYTPDKTRKTMSDYHIIDNTMIPVENATFLAIRPNFKSLW